MAMAFRSFASSSGRAVLSRAGAQSSVLGNAARFVPSQAQRFGGSQLAAARYFASARLYAETHEWVELAEDKMSATMGVSDFAQKELGAIVYIDFGQEGHEVGAKDSVCAIECGDGKAVGEVYAPATCEIVKVNDSLEDNPSLVNESPYDDGWLVKVKFTEAVSKESLGMLDETEYEKFLETCETSH